MMTAYIDSEQLEWDFNLNKLAYAYNSSVHSTTGFTPFEMQFGRQPKMPIDLIIENQNEDGLGRPRREMDELTVNDGGYVTTLADCEGLYNKELPESATRHVNNLKTKLIKVYNKASNNRDYNMNIHKIYYDRNLNPNEYHVNDLVLTDHVKIKTGIKRGLAHKFHGPFRVLAKLPNGVDYLIRKADSQNSKRFVIHNNRLKKYFGTANEGSHNDEDMRTIKTEGKTTR